MYKTLKEAFEIHPPDGLERCDSVCAITSERITEGYPTNRIISKATAGLSDLLKNDSEYISETAGALLKASKILRGNLLVLNGVGIRPMISEKSATGDRPSWASLIKNMAIGDKTIAIISDEFKKRLWHKSVLSEVGKSWKVFFNGTPYKGGEAKSRILKIDFQKLIKLIDMIEEIYSIRFPRKSIAGGLLKSDSLKKYSIGFSKKSIACGLLNQDNLKLIEKIGFKEVKKMDSILDEYRATDEMILSVFISQKREDIKNEKR